MLAPLTEAHPTEGPLLQLALAAAERYPAFVGELAAATGINPMIRTDGTLALALDSDDRAQLAVHAAHLRALGLGAEELTGRECRRLEPGLAPDVRGGLFVAGDHSVDNRRLLRALRAATPPPVEAAAVRVREGNVELADGRTLPADVVVIAAGCWSGRLHPALDGLIRPVKGEILRLRARPWAAPPTRTLRATVRGKSVYVVPRADGELVVGATQLEAGFEATVTAGGVYELLRDARAVLPGIDEFELAECAAGLRPGSPDNAPLIGELAPGVVAATGHGRNGVLLAGVTADAVAELVCGGALPAYAKVADPGRAA
jgi:glycine oxidase